MVSVSKVGVWHRSSPLNFPLHCHICKAITYAADDKRKINLRLQEHSVCYLITDKSKVDIAGLVKGLGEYIKVNHMDCVWDFIYEVQT